MGRVYTVTRTCFTTLLLCVLAAVVCALSVPRVAWAQSEADALPGAADPPPPLVEDEGGGGVGSAWIAVELKEIGLTDLFKKYNRKPETTFWIPSREDMVLTAARLTLEFDMDVAFWDQIVEVEVLINYKLIARLNSADIRKQPVQKMPVDSVLLTGNTALTLKLITADTHICLALVPLETWNLLKRGVFEMRAMQLPMPNSLAMLPMPFLDPGFDRFASVPLVILAPINAGTLKAAGTVAAYFGMRSGSRINTEVHLDSLPDKSAVVLVLGHDYDDLLKPPKPPKELGADPDPYLSPTQEGDAAAVAEAAEAGGEGAPPLVSLARNLEIVNHPKFPEGQYKLLILRGESVAELEEAAQSLFLIHETEERQRELARQQLENSKREPYDAPLWLNPKDKLKFSEIPGGEEMIHRGLSGGTMLLEIRLTPDLFDWPSRQVLLSLDIEHHTPEQQFVPTLVVEINGVYLRRLDPCNLSLSTCRIREKIELPQGVLKGYNQFKIHVSWPKLEEICDEEIEEFVETRVSGESYFRFNNLPHFAYLPDMQMFVEDGFPFTRMADLSETVVVVPPNPSRAELSTLFSLMSHFAATTGVPPLRAAYSTSLAHLPSTFAGKDILVVAEASNLAVLSRWQHALPLGHRMERFRVNMPSYYEQMMIAFGWRWAPAEARDIEEVLRRHPKVGVALGIQSPFDSERQVVVVSATEAAQMPSVPDMLSYTHAVRRGGDVLLIGKDMDNWRFLLNRRTGVGDLSWYTRLQWYLSNHWVMLVPFVLISILLLSWIFYQAFQRRERERLHLE